MGNVASCAPSMASNNGVIKLLHSDGTLQIYTTPIKAGEVMVENPGEFLCDFNSLEVGQRIQGLLADEVLERRQLYFLLPMDLLYSVLTHEEMSTLSLKANKALKFKYSHLKSWIFPVLISEFCVFPSEIETMDTSTRSSEQPKPLLRSFSRQRSWKPALETIVET